MDDECADVFRNGDYKGALELLQKVSNPKSIKVSNFFTQNYKPIYSIQYEKISLLRVAAYHGWLDICHKLIAEYKYDPCVHGTFGSLTETSYIYIPQYKPSHFRTSSSFVFQHIPPPPLFYATLRGKHEIITYLINKYHCDPHQQSKNGETPLYLACLGGHYEIVTYLINECGCNVATGKYSPLHAACYAHNLAILQYLVSSSSVDVNIIDTRGYTPLHIACEYGYIDIVQYLLSLPLVDVNIKASDVDHFTPLQVACFNGKLDIVNILLSRSSVDINSTQVHRALYLACINGKLDIVKMFLSVDRNSEVTVVHSALLYACEHGKNDIVHYLVSSFSVDVNIRKKDSNTPLHLACYGKLDLVQYLLSLPSIVVNIKNDDGYTPLHIACQYGQLDIVQCLVSQSSSDMNITANDGYTPLHTACSCGKLDVVKYLVSSSLVNVNVKDSFGNTPLHTACCHCKVDIIEYLLSLSTVDVNINFHDIKTVKNLLQDAMFSDKLNTVKFLILSSADLTFFGVTPLHKACQYGKLDIVKSLVALPSVDVNSKSSCGDSPLHTACRYGQLEILKFLLSLSSIDVNTKTSIGCTQLHTACEYGKLDVVKCLVSLPSVDVNSKTFTGDTPLHRACHYGKLDIVKFLVSLPSVDVNTKTSAGDTPLHTACQYGKLDIVKFLVSLPSVDVNTKSSTGDTPLHTACQYGELDIVKCLVSLNVNTRTSTGGTPLHIACEQMYKLDLVKVLVSLPSVDVNTKGDAGYTPLHTACRYGKLDILKFLVSLPSVDVNSKTSTGDTLLHTACRYDQLYIIKFLLSSFSIDVNIKDDENNTLLLAACRYDLSDVIEVLVSTKQVPPIYTTEEGNTLLHIACKYGCVNVVKYLLSTGHVDPMAKNRYDITPVQMAEQNYSILKLFEPFEQCRVEFPVESYIKVFLCGDTTNGKSSLANALWQRASGASVSTSLRNKLRLPIKYRRKVEPLTAGIVPHHLQINEIGNIVLYDFAGHREYYSSHAAVLENLMLTSPAVFIILVKLTDKLEDIKKQLYYWASFIQNVCHRISKKSQVIIVGSHADKRIAKNGKAFIENFDIQGIIGELEYKAFVAMDCRHQTRTEFDQFITYVSESKQVIVNRSDSISFYCHVLYAFLKTNVDEIAITIEDLLQKIQDEYEASLPSTKSVVLELLTTLSDKGLILFIRNTNFSNSWVVIDKMSLLKEINGTLFAPEYFKQHRSTLASNTGILPVSSLNDVFPQYNLDMLVGFLKSLEFCHEIDEDTLRIINNTLPPRRSYSDKLLYFPALASQVMKKPVITCGFGWCLWCPKQNQFLSIRFLHVLLLRLAHKLPLKVLIGSYSTEKRIDIKDLIRFCNVWKNGICWRSDGVEVIIQVSEQNRSVILLVQPIISGSDKKCVQVRNSIVNMIHEIQKEFSPSCDIQEYIISPNQLHSILQRDLNESSIFRIEYIARAALLGLPITNKSETLELTSLLGQFEPYLSLPLSVIQQLFDESKVNQRIPERHLRRIQESCKSIMDIDPDSSTFQSVRDHLNRFSVFTGRNPIVSE